MHLLVVQLSTNEFLLVCHNPLDSDHLPSIQNSMLVVTKFLYDSFFMPLQIHFGVNSGASNLAVERRAVNEATFRCPDQLGWQPQVCFRLSLLKAVCLVFG